MASFLSPLPWLVTLSYQKNWVFLIAGLLIAGNFLYQNVSTRRQAQRHALPMQPTPVPQPLEPVALQLDFRRHLLHRHFQRPYILGPFLMSRDR